MGELGHKGINYITKSHKTGKWKNRMEPMQRPGMYTSNHYPALPLSAGSIRNQYLEKGLV